MDTFNIRFSSDPHRYILRILRNSSIKDAGYTASICCAHVDLSLTTVLHSSLTSLAYR